MSTSELVAAVVVTHNRKDMLSRCLQGILTQTRAVQGVVLIDNASVDATLEMLVGLGVVDSASYLLAKTHQGTKNCLSSSKRWVSDINVEYVRLMENQGGAGGVHEGIKRAYRSGFDWMWLMDDDGLPSETCLERLLGAPKEALARGPVVIEKTETGHQELSFPWIINGKFIDTLTELRLQSADGHIWGFLNPWNGCMLNRQVVQRIGLPIRDMFLWGEETEYFLRMRKDGIKMVTVIDAIHEHPKDRMHRREVRFLFGKGQISSSDSKFKNYLIVRNGAYIAFRYFGVIAWLSHTVKYALHWATVGAQVGKLSTRTVLKASFEGLLGRLEGHNNLLEGANEG